MKSNAILVALLGSALVLGGNVQAESSSGGCKADKHGCAGMKAKSESGCHMQAEKMKKCGGMRSECKPSNCKTGSKEAEAKDEAAVTTAALSSLINSGTEVVLLDARSGKYDDGKRIPGAKSLNASHSDEEIASMVPNKESLVVTYCSNLKCPASAQLSHRLKKLGYSNVIEYPEGIQGWVESGGEIQMAN